MSYNRFTPFGVVYRHTAVLVATATVLSCTPTGSGDDSDGGAPLTGEPGTEGGPCIVTNDFCPWGECETAKYCYAPLICNGSTCEPDEYVTDYFYQSCDGGALNDAGECSSSNEDYRPWETTDAAVQEPDMYWEPSYYEDFCIAGCFNQDCPGSYDMCTTWGGECQPVDCNDDADCLYMSICDDPDKSSSPLFICDDNGQCKRD